MLIIISIESTDLCGTALYRGSRSMCDILQLIDRHRSSCHFCRSTTTWSRLFHKSTTLLYLTDSFEIDHVSSQSSLFVIYLQIYYRKIVHRVHTSVMRKTATAIMVQRTGAVCM